MTMTEDPPVVADMGGAPSAPASAGETKGKKAKKDKGAKGRSNLLPALVLAGGMAAGGYFMGGGGSSAATTEPTVAESAPVPGEMVRIDPLTLNLAEGRFLRLGVAFQMTTTFEPIEGDDGELVFSPADEGRLRDLLIAMFSGRDGDNLIGADDREQVKEELLESANEVFDGQVLSVYLTDLVMQ